MRVPAFENMASGCFVFVLCHALYTDRIVTVNHMIRGSTARVFAAKAK